MRVDQVVAASNKLVRVLVMGVVDLNELHPEVARLMHVLLVALLGKSQHSAGAGARLQLDHGLVRALCHSSSVRMNFAVGIFNCLEATAIEFLERAAELNFDVGRGRRRRLVLCLVAIPEQTTINVSSLDFEVAGQRVGLVEMLFEDLLRVAKEGVTSNLLTEMVLNARLQAILTVHVVNGLELMIR